MNDEMRTAVGYTANNKQKEWNSFLSDYRKYIKLVII